MIVCCFVCNICVRRSAAARGRNKSVRDLCIVWILSCVV